MSPLAPQLGRPLVELGSGYPPTVALPALTEILTTASPCFSIGTLLSLGGTLIGTTATTANKPWAFPFVIDEGVTVYQLGWICAAAPGGNADIGIYDTSWNRLVSAGSTSGAGTSLVWTWVDVVDTLLPAGSYYLAYCRDDVTVNRFATVQNVSAQPICALAGVMDSSTSAFPLPDPLTNMVVDVTNIAVPILGIAIRALV